MIKVLSISGLIFMILSLFLPCSITSADTFFPPSFRIESYGFQNLLSYALFSLVMIFWLISLKTESMWTPGLIFLCGLIVIVLSLFTRSILRPPHTHISSLSMSLEFGAFLLFSAFTFSAAKNNRNKRKSNGELLDEDF